MTPPSPEIPYAGDCTGHGRRRSGTRTTACSTRPAYGDGEGWYVATAPDQPGADQVVPRVLVRHDLIGPYVGYAGQETAT
ncbi:hypothetical protein [Streptomyces griseorubiginosus]|uniref:hypothetical protein n=1 Tax=Streptomyces griseorubiginosus TaxID=67304 RepID=UPI003651CA67